MSNYTNGIVWSIGMGYPCMRTPLEIVFHEQSYYSLHSGQTLAWDHFHSIITNQCGDWQSPMQRMETVQAPMPIIIKHHETLVKHCETQVKHCETQVKHCETFINHHETL